MFAFLMVFGAIIVFLMGLAIGHAMGKEKTPKIGRDDKKILAAYRQMDRKLQRDLSGEVITGNPAAVIVYDELTKIHELDN